MHVRRLPLFSLQTFLFTAAFWLAATNGIWKSINAGLAWSLKKATAQTRHRFYYTKILLDMRLIFSLLLALAIARAFAQPPDSLLVHRAALDYLEGFYEGDTLKLQRSLSPELHKYGYYKDKAGQYEGDKMTFADAIAFAKNVLEKKRFPKPDTPKQVSVLEVQEQIACVKVVAWWGMDYLLLAKHGGKWRIEQVIWQGPLNTVKRTTHNALIDRLVGTWKYVEGQNTYVEHWEKTGDSIFECKATSTSGSKTTSTEHFRIEKKGNDWLMTAESSNSAPSTFYLKTAENNSLSFERKEDDFPKRFNYDWKKDGTLVVWLDGKLNGQNTKLEYPMKKLDK